MHAFDDVTNVNLLSLLTDAGIVQSLTEADLPSYLICWAA